MQVLQGVKGWLDTTPGPLASLVFFYAELVRHGPLVEPSRQTVFWLTLLGKCVLVKMPASFAGTVLFFC